ncbi:hypothetical protein [Helicobacter ailurogastricus]|uniref:Lipoprotein n=1 Tax=Helicobacter ailurogastricus TaxID=1578720 RepID=A0A0K2X7U1_9HELI|nr:hypothetical protein [Helicobacter ailurogastricus]CRF40886.1 hypothetical protein HAL011_06550 [Helicobacter ailurogastricus]CRF42111.1 hypothetical protein HAL013_02680 [Helicobacter ailurogastricus]CRF44025.1 hypothetical protein HAL09_05930 [Helicobacter ailurogastricus]
MKTRVLALALALVFGVGCAQKAACDTKPKPVAKGLAQEAPSEQCPDNGEPKQIQ